MYMPTQRQRQRLSRSYKKKPKQRTQKTFQKGGMKSMLKKISGSNRYHCTDETANYNIWIKFKDSISIVEFYSDGNKYYVKLYNKEDGTFDIEGSVNLKFNNDSSFAISNKFITNMALEDEDKHYVMRKIN